jgi:hypothetical protein
MLATEKCMVNATPATMGAADTSGISNIWQAVARP